MIYLRVFGEDLTFTFTAGSDNEVNYFRVSYGPKIISRRALRQDATAPLGTMVLTAIMIMMIIEREAAFSYHHVRRLLALRALPGLH
jgi:hypothetical protein